jgi:hypothetical protein
LGSSYDNNFLPYFDKFLGAVYGAEFIILKLNHSQLIIHIDKKICDSRALSSLSHERTPDAGISDDATPSIPVKRKHGPSEYEQRRQANISENHRLLASLGLSGGGSSALVKSSAKGKNKKGDKSKRYGFCFAYIFHL